MKLNTKFRAITGISFAFLVLSGAVLFFLSCELKLSLQLETVSSSIARDIFTRADLREQYLQHSEKRIFLQWETVDKRLEKEIEKMSQLPLTSAQRRILARLTWSHRENQEAFRLLALIFKENPESSSNALSRARRNILIQRIHLRVEEMIDSAREMEETNRMRVSKKFTQAIVLLVLMLALLVVVLSLNAWTIGQGIVNPIGQLYSGIKKIAEGNLDCNVEIASRDEIGELALAFNEMSHKLKVSYGTLETEIAERKQAEEKVRLTTQQLKESNRQLQEKSVNLEAVAKDLRDRTERLQRFNNLTVDRELEMVRLKAEVDRGLEKLGQPKKYDSPGKPMSKD